MGNSFEQHSAGCGRALFISDLDGTLLNDSKRISSRNLEALVRMRRSGIFIALATGRSNHSLGVLMGQLEDAGAAVDGQSVGHVIFSTGAGIMEYPGGKILRNVCLMPEEVRHIAAVLDGSGLDYMVHRPVPDTVHFLYALHTLENSDFHRRLEYYRDFATPISPAALAAFGRATEVLCIVPEQHGHAIAERLRLILPQFSVVKATSPLDGRSLWIEIFPAIVSKSLAAAWLADHLGVARQRVCAVGNDFNDEDLLHWSGRGFVVANSPEPLRREFFTVASNNCHGVAEAAAEWLNW